MEAAKKPGRPRNANRSAEDQRLHRAAGQSPEIAARRKAKEPPSPTVTVTLSMRHSRNQNVYGPGPTELPRALADELLQIEARHNADLHSDRAFLIGPRGSSGHVVKPVPNEFFNSGDEDTRELTCFEYWDRQTWRPPEPFIKPLL